MPWSEEYVMAEKIGKGIISVLMKIHAALVRPEGTTEAGTLMVTKSWRNRGKDEMDGTITEKLEVKTFSTTPARVKASWGETVPRAEKFSFYRIDVGVEIPCYSEEINETLDEALDMVKKRVNQEMGKDNAPDDGIPRI